MNKPIRGIIAATTALLLYAGSAQAADYGIDPAHSFLMFRISHLGFSIMIGRFDKIAGDFSWDKDKPDASAIALKIDPASVNTNWAERDKHLRSPDFLDVEKFTEASFKSSKYTGDASGGTLDGELTLHGVTKAIAIEVKAVGEGADPWGGYRAGFDGTTSINRSDYGVSKDLGPASEKMQFDLHIEGIKKQ